MSVIENLIKYYQWERATSFNGEVIIPSRRFAIECIIEQYSKMNNQSEREIEILEYAKKRLVEFDAGINE